MCGVHSSFFVRWEGLAYWVQFLPTYSVAKFHFSNTHAPAISDDSCLFEVRQCAAGVRCPRTPAARSRTPKETGKWMTGACMKKNRNFVPKNSLTGTASNMAADFYRNKKEPCTPGHCRWMDTILFRYKNVFKIWRTPFSQ